MTSPDRIAVMTGCTALSLAGAIAFPEVVRRLCAAGVERYHVDLTRNEKTYYLPCGESHVVPMAGPGEPIAEGFDAGAVEAAVRAVQRGEFGYVEFLRRVRAAGCVGYFAQLAGRRVQYVGRTGDAHVEPFPPAKG
jgi:uncharacterized protein YbcV (DUF1398 family)